MLVTIGSPAVISIHAPREGSDSLGPVGRGVAGISIHAPREGSDRIMFRKPLFLRIISIHAPREGSDRLLHNLLHAPPYFNPRSPRGERRSFSLLLIPAKLFQSTLPARGATSAISMVAKKAGISIHAPREGSDRRYYRFGQPWNYFNPRSPRGERLNANWADVSASLFQSTLPARGATMYFGVKTHGTGQFQSTLPARGATPQVPQPTQQQNISIHAPREGSDPRTGGTADRPRHFNPRSPRGERLVDFL